MERYSLHETTFYTILFYISLLLLFGNWNIETNIIIKIWYIIHTLLFGIYTSLSLYPEETEENKLKMYPVKKITTLFLFRIVYIIINLLVYNQEYAVLNLQRYVAFINGIVMFDTYLNLKKYIEHNDSILLSKSEVKSN